MQSSNEKQSALVAVAEISEAELLEEENVPEQELVEFPDEIVRDIFHVPYWYRMSEEEYWNYCRILSKAGEEKANSAREKECAESEECLCYHCNKPGYVKKVTARTKAVLDEEEAEREAREANPPPVVEFEVIEPTPTVQAPSVPTVQAPAAPAPVQQEQPEAPAEEHVQAEAASPIADTPQSPDPSPEPEIDPESYYDTGSSPEVAANNDTPRSHREDHAFEQQDLVYEQATPRAHRPPRRRRLRWSPYQHQRGFHGDNLYQPGPSHHGPQQNFVHRLAGLLAELQQDLHPHPQARQPALFRANSRSNIYGHQDRFATPQPHLPQALFRANQTLRRAQQQAVADHYDPLEDEELGPIINQRWNPNQEF